MCQMNGSVPSYSNYKQDRINTLWGRYKLRNRITSRIFQMKKMNSSEIAKSPLPFLSVTKFLHVFYV